MFGNNFRRNSAFLGFLIMGLSFYSQDLSHAYRTFSSNIGKLYNENDVTAKTYSFTYSIYDFHADTLNSSLYFTVREKDGSGKFFKNNGFQFALNYKQDTITWVNDVRKFEITKVDKHLIMSSDVATSKFNKVTGLEQFQHTGKLIYTDVETNLGLMYTNVSKDSPKTDLKGVNIEDGTVLFETKLPNEFDWIEAVKPNDSTLLISSSGVHGVNLKTGKIWSVADIIGEKNKQKLIQSIINPNAFRVKHQSFLESDNENILTQICSNILVNGDEFYFATKTAIYSIKIADGAINWKTDLSTYPVSKSALFLKEGKIYMLNLGVANYKDIQVVYGAPFLAQFDQTTGTLNFQNPLPMFSYPVDYVIQNDLVLAGKNNLYLINISDGRFFNEIDVNELRYGNFQEFVNGDDYYVEKEGYFVPLNFINDNVVYFRSSHGKVYGVEGGKIQYEYHESELYRLDKMFSNFKLIKQKFKTYVLNANFELLAVMDIEEPATVVGQKLFYFSGRKMHVLDASDFRK